MLIDEYEYGFSEYSNVNKFFFTRYTSQLKDIIHLLAVVCFYEAELSESDNEWADQAGKKVSFCCHAALHYYTIQIVYRV